MPLILGEAAATDKPRGSKPASPTKEPSRESGAVVKGRAVDGPPPSQSPTVGSGCDRGSQCWVRDEDESGYHANIQIAKNSRDKLPRSAFRGRGLQRREELGAGCCSS